MIKQTKNKAFRFKVYKQMLVEINNLVYIDSGTGFCHLLKCVGYEISNDPKKYLSAHFVKKFNDTLLTDNFEPYDWGESLYALININNYPELMYYKPNPLLYSPFWFPDGDIAIRKKILKEILGIEP